jgi:NADH-quinone oxidoreductase subunit M
VVTAVYILRAIGKTMMGPIENPDYNLVKDAAWNETIAAGILMIGILLIGVAPFILTGLIDKGTTDIMYQILSVR